MSANLDIKSLCTTCRVLLILFIDEPGLFRNGIFNNNHVQADKNPSFYNYLLLPRTLNGKSNLLKK